MNELMWYVENREKTKRKFATELGPKMTDRVIVVTSVCFTYLFTHILNLKDLK